jgi:hypothetical protein
MSRVVTLDTPPVVGTEHEGRELGAFRLGAFREHDLGCDDRARRVARPSDTI